jgi:pimeloyl-ACP methyl ester carboxylesterase
MTATEVGTRRFDVRSADGTPLAVWVDGHGPPLVLVHGSLCDHTAFDPLVAELCGAMTTYSVDRRGFGASGDAAGYAIERETAVRLVLVGIVGVTEAELDALRSGPRWPAMLASVPTVPRECRAEDGWRYRPGALDGIAAPTLMLAAPRARPCWARRRTGRRGDPRRPGRRGSRATPTSPSGPTRPWVADVIRRFALG